MVHPGNCLASIVFAEQLTTIASNGLGNGAGPTTRSDFGTPNRTWFKKPVIKRETDLAALRLFCLFSFIFVGLIVAGVI
jgi:hypothetical protein